MAFGPHFEAGAAFPSLAGFFLDFVSDANAAASLNGGIVRGFLGFGLDGIELRLFFLIVFKIVVSPYLGSEGSVGDMARIENDVVEEGIELGEAEIGAGGLQGVKEEAGGFVLDFVRDEQTHDLHDGHLDGVGVFEDGKNEGGRAATGAVGVEADALVLEALVEKTITVAAECGRSALGAIDFEVLTAVGITSHLRPPPPLP